MKSISSIKTIAVGVLVAFGSLAYGQCGDDMIPDAQGKLGSFVYVKDVRVKLKKSRRKKGPEKVEQKFMLSKNNEYKFVVRNEDDEDAKVIVTLYSHMGGKIMSNYDPRTKRYLKEFSFKCRSAAPVKIVAQFQDGSGGCSICVIGSRKFN